MKIILTAVTLCLLALTGCISPEQQAERDDDTCRGYGAKRGTPIYVECRMRQVEQRQRRAADLDSTYCRRGPYGSGYCF